MRLTLALTIAILALGACADDFRVAADGGRAEIQRAIDAAAGAGGGRVVVAPGVHQIGTLRLKSHVELHLEEGAVLLGSTNRSDYEEFPVEVCSVSPGNDKCSLVMAWDAEGVAITGKGTIDGQGPAFYDRRPPRGHWPKPKSGFRPHMIRFIRCRDVRLEGVTFRNFDVKCAKPLRFLGNHDSILTNIRLENFKAEVKASTPFEAVATEPLTFRNCTFNGAKMPDGDLTTPRGKRKPFIRSKSKSWETLNQSAAK